MVEPLNRLINKSLDFEWNGEAQKAFDLTKEKLCSAPVLALPREEGTFILDAVASDVAISGILHQEQEIDGKLIFRPIAYGSKMLSAAEHKYGAAKAEKLAAVQFIEKFKFHSEGREFILRVDNIALKWLKTYSMTSVIVACWITILGAFKMRIEHRLRDKHFKADGFSKKTEFCESREEYDRIRPDVSLGFAFLDQDYYDQLQTVPWLDKDGRETTPKMEELACSNNEPTNIEKVYQLSQGPKKGPKVRVLKKDKTVDPTEFPVTESKKLCRETPHLTENERLALAKITKADSPFFSPVVREDEPMIAEPPSAKMVALCAESLNAGAQEGDLEMIPAVKLVNAATYSVADLSRAQRTDLVTAAIRKCMQEGQLRGTPHKTKPSGSEENQLDADVGKIIRDFYNYWKAQLYVNSQDALCCRRKPDEKIFDHDAIVLPQLYHAEVLFRAHNEQGHQRMDKVIARVEQRFIWPGLNSAVK